MDKTGRKRMKGFVFLLALLMMLATLGSCMTPAGRTPGEVVDDATITTKVKAKLLEDSILRGLAISVQTFEGNVTLIGAVENEKQKEQATVIAQSVSGVRKVNNLLTLKK